MSSDRQDLESFDRTRRQDLESFDRSRSSPIVQGIECEAQDEAAGSTKEQRPGEELERALEREKQLVKEFKNYRRHAEAALADAQNNARVQLLAELGDIVRLLELAAEAADQDPDSVREGIELVARSMQKIYQEHGLERIETRKAAFDPALHEAVLTEHSPGLARGTVVQELSPGFRLADRVVRPAKVSVAA